MSRPKRRVKLMPAIREESQLGTGRIPVHIIPPGTRPLGLGKNNSMIIQNLPEEPKKPPPKVTPSNRHHSSVEQVVSDYLHFSRYGETLPITHGFAPSACPCCLDRNRENMQRLQDRRRAPPQAPDPDSMSVPPLDHAPDPAPGPSHAHSPRRQGQGQGGVSFSNQVDVRQVSPRRGVRDDGDPRTQDFPSSWMSYQPMPMARTFLNAEFSRASHLQGYEQDRRQYEDASMAYVSGRVLDANTKYDLAMKKLERSLNNFKEDSDFS